jgi:putative ATPase
MYSPLADRLRPQTLDDVVGQPHLLNKNAVLRRIIETGNLPNLIFYGPSGVGKTTVASIIANATHKKLYKLNGTTASTGDIKAIVSGLETFEGINGVLLYLDEIQYLNKKQQQSLLEFIENGQITLIASTTENPYFYIYNAILSRSTIFEFKPVNKDEIKKACVRAFKFIEDEQNIKIDANDEVLEHISLSCGGDVRKAINAAELLCLSAKEENGVCMLNLEDAKNVSQRSSMKYDRDGDAHYDILSAFQKSVRGSDANAALHYLARLCEAGDLTSACRRLLVMASEDIGLAYPMAAVITKSCVDSALQLGLPEARIPLAQAVVLLCTAPKSNSSYCAIDAAIEDIRTGKTGDIPAHIRDAHYAGAKTLGRGRTYKYPHSYPDHFVKQQYLPDELKDAKYYLFGENKTEQAAKAYWDIVKSKIV